MQTKGNRPTKNTSRYLIVIKGFLTNIKTTFISLLIHLLLPVSSCMVNNESTVPTNESVADKLPRQSVIIKVDDKVTTAKNKPKRLILLSFDSEDTGKLISFDKFEFTGDSYEIDGYKGSREIIALANFPYEIDTSRLNRLETAELMSSRLEDDCPASPLMSGQCWTDGTEAALVRVSPLLTRITLTRVDFLDSGTGLLEDTELAITSFPEETEIMRTYGFRPSHINTDTLKVFLGMDIGAYPAFPDASLFCYPNDDIHRGAGCPPTSLSFRCKLFGETCEFSAELPPLGRNTVTEASLVIEGPGKYEFLFQ